MSKTTKVLFVLSLSFLAAGLVFVTGLINVGEAVALYATLPAGAICLGLFLISLTLQTESALFDEEHRALTAALAPVKPLTVKSCCDAKAAGKETLAAAHAH